jgi:hypothetical protein
MGGMDGSRATCWWVFQTVEPIAARIGGRGGHVRKLTSQVEVFLDFGLFVELIGLS